MCLCSVLLRMLKSRGREGVIAVRSASCVCTQKHLAVCAYRVPCLLVVMCSHRNKWLPWVNLAVEVLMGSSTSCVSTPPTMPAPSSQTIAPCPMPHPFTRYAWFHNHSLCVPKLQSLRQESQDISRSSLRQTQSVCVCVIIRVCVCQFVCLVGVVRSFVCLQV